MKLQLVLNDVGSFMLFFALHHLRFSEIPASKVPSYKFSWNPCNPFSLSQSGGKCSSVAVSILSCLNFTQPPKNFFVCFMSPCLRKFHLNLLSFIIMISSFAIHKNETFSQEDLFFMAGKLTCRALLEHQCMGNYVLL